MTNGRMKRSVCPFTREPKASACRFGQGRAEFARGELFAREEDQAEAGDERVLDRIEGIADRIAQVVDLVRTEGGASGAGFQVVRYFEDPNGEEEVIRRVGNLESLTGQHQLLGWHLDKRLMDFLIRTGTELDADEYG